MTNRIEHYLSTFKGWTPASMLCLVFGISERELRSNYDRPGLCSEFAISGPLGFRHIKHCTDEEWTAFHDRMRGHAIAELTRVSKLRKRRNQTT